MTADIHRPMKISRTIRVTQSCVGYPCANHSDPKVAGLTVSVGSQERPCGFVVHVCHLRMTC